MNPNSFALLYNDFMASINDPDKMIDFYQRNALFLNNIKAINDTNDLNSYILIINHYTSALWQKKRFTQTVEVVNEKLPFIDSEIARLNAPELKHDWYYYILFYKAASLNSQRNYKAAHPIFTELTHHDPENELFRNWLRHTDQGVNMWILSILSILGVALIVADIILSIFAPTFRYRSLIFYTGLILTLGAAACEYYLKYKLKKNK